MEAIIIIAIIFGVFFWLAWGKSSDDMLSVNAKNNAQYDDEESDDYFDDVDDFDYDERPNEKPSGKLAKWYGNGQSTEVQGYNIPGGLVYIGTKLPGASGYGTDACLINPKLKVLPAEPSYGGDKMPYWPKYGDIPQRCRGAYLKWLADGRSDPDAYIGYVFLFFYGLERRLFIDHQKDLVSAEEKEAIIYEINRLLKIYGKNHSFYGYAKKYLAIQTALQWLVHKSGESIPDFKNFNDGHHSELFQAILAHHVAVGSGIPPDIALQWIVFHPNFWLKTPARRCAKEFKKLFSHRYKEQYGDGIIVRPNKLPLKFDYYPASPSMGGYITSEVMGLTDPFMLKAPMKKINALVEECTIDLDDYSRFIGRKNNNPKSLAAIALLPKELLESNKTIRKAKSQLTKICNDGAGTMSVENLYSCFGETKPLQMGKKESESLAALVEKVGFGLVPDSRFHHIRPNLGGQVAIFPHGHGADFEPSVEYQTGAIILRLGAMVSQTDDGALPARKAILQSLINENEDLTQTEKDSLQAFLQWCLKTPQGTSGIKQQLTEVATTEKMAISRILISIALADGRISPNEVKNLEKLYMILGLEKSQVASDLHSLAAENGPVTVGVKDAEQTFSIPTPSSENAPTKGFRLNPDLIQTRAEETKKVQNVLNEIFNDPEKEEQPKNDAATRPSGTHLAALDKAHHDLFHRLLEQETWERSSLKKICKDLGLMVDGAMEVLNEWSFNSVDAALIEDGDPIYVDMKLAQEIINVEQQ